MVNGPYHEQIHTHTHTNVCMRTKTHAHTYTQSALPSTPESPPE